MHTLILQLFDAISLKEKRLIGKVLVILPRTRRGASWCSVDMRYTHPDFVLRHGLFRVQLVEIDGTSARRNLTAPASRFVSNLGN